MMLQALNVAITVAIPLLAFFAGIYFQRWMRERVEHRNPRWGRGR